MELIQTEGFSSDSPAIVDEEDSSPKSLCKRSLLYRPLPQGKRVYFVLLQVLLLAIVRSFAEQFFNSLVLEHSGKHSSHGILEFFSFTAFVFLFSLPMGFIADSYSGRAKMLYYSWLLLFISQLSFVLYFLIEPHSKPTAITIAITGLVINAFSMAGAWINLILFGIDQLRTASSDELSSYLHWHYWAINAGALFVYSLGGLMVQLKHFLPHLVSTIVITIGVVINFVGYDWFSKSEKVDNPVLLICRVLRYALTAKRPTERSAFSFDDRSEPSRLDLAKQTHYGIFRDEQVEDVKIFLRILGFVLLLFGYLCVGGLVCIFTCVCVVIIWMVLSLVVDWTYFCSITSEAAKLLRIYCL